MVFVQFLWGSVFNASAANDYERAMMFVALRVLEGKSSDGNIFVEILGVTRHYIGVMLLY